VANKAKIRRLTAQLKAEQENLALEQKTLKEVANATTAQLYTMLQTALTAARARIVAMEAIIATKSIDGLKGLGSELQNATFLFNKPYKELKARQTKQDK